MGKYASGKFAKRISDRSGMAFPYNEMVQEWNGSWVHTSEYEPKQPQLEPLPIVTDPQSLQYARSQIANSRVFVGGALGPINAGRTVATPPQGEDAAYDGKGFGLQVNQFQTLDMPVTNYYANGVAYASTQKSMMPLSVQQPNKPTQLNSGVGNVTVSTS
tara:strand:- start:104 stop:583 length:480 start_codon:yes stop_codon:yes gene_type:complete